jgi:thymidylate kinase
MSKIIAFEGIAGAGKTTTACVVRRFLSKRGYKVLLINEKELEPFKSWVVNWYKRPLGHRIFSIEDVKSIAQARYATHESLQPVLAGQDLVIFDRCLFTSAVYQQSQEVGWERILEINFEQGVVVPERVFLFLGNPDICYRRMLERSQQKTSYQLPATIETRSQLLNHRCSYLKMLNRIPNPTLLDACLPTARKAQIILQTMRMLHEG